MACRSPPSPCGSRRQRVRIHRAGGDHAERARLRHGERELGVGRRPAHASLDDRIADADELGDAGGKIHSSLAPVATTTGPHFACSAFTKAANSAGEVGAGTASWLSNSFLSSAERKVATTALCSLSKLSGGTPAGAERPYQLSDSTVLNPASPVVGTSGSAPLRVCEVTASALTVPARMCGSRTGVSSTTICTWPPMRSFTAGAAPR